MTVQIVSIGVVFVIVFFVLRQQNKKDRRYFGGPIEYTRKEKKLMEKYLQEYEPVQPDNRLSTIRKNKWELEDIAKSATEMIYDSPIPSKALRTNLRTGDLVKLVFMTNQKDGMAERMWIKVMGQRDGLYFGKLHNEPLDIAGLAPGQVIWFHPNHVFNIDQNKGRATATNA